jgi:hypothetical protein
MAHTEYEDRVRPDNKYGPMGRAAPEAVVKLAKFVREVVVLLGQGAALRIPGKRMDGLGKAVIPLVGLFEGTILGPPRTGVSQILVCSVGEENAVVH